MRGTALRFVDLDVLTVCTLRDLHHNVVSFLASCMLSSGHSDSFGLPFQKRFAPRGDANWRGVAASYSVNTADAPCVSHEAPVCTNRASEAFVRAGCPRPVVPEWKSPIRNRARRWINVSGRCAHVLRSVSARDVCHFRSMDRHLDAAPIELRSRIGNRSALRLPACSSSSTDAVGRSFGVPAKAAALTSLEVRASMCSQ